MSEPLNGAEVNVDAIAANEEVPMTPEQALEAYKAMPVDEQAKVVAQVAEIQSQVADGMLAGPKGWDILKQLSLDSAKRILLTQEFVVPTMGVLPDILKAVKDPDAFKQGFDQLSVDIRQYNQSLLLLQNQHRHNEGAVSADQVETVAKLADGYAVLMNDFDETIQPLMTTLIEIVATEYLPTIADEETSEQ